MTNPELELAWQYIANTDKSVFLTGKAGTGKTTFLRRIQELSPKRKIVVAPTGVAAINAHGVTIHSQFQLPLAPYIPGTTIGEDTTKHYRVSKEKKEILRTLDLLVIDEISMVRCDIMDAIDNVLRKYRRHDLPFGGVQLLLIGDLQQLAPVTVEKEWALLRQYYDTPYFFSSKALQQISYVTIELRQVYRQTDSRFIELLNKIREDRLDTTALSLLNSRVGTPQQTPAGGTEAIRLTTHNLMAQRYNDDRLAALSAQTHTFEATVTDNFPETSFPADRILTLKVGAQVMFIRNDTLSGRHQYYNGKIGTVIDIQGRDVKVKCEEDAEPISVNRETWENTRYVIDADTKEIHEEVEGTFSQLPLRLAWAITVHKSQGLTFDRVVLDINSSFAHGQVYVALSRCRTLEGLTLTAPLATRSVMTDRLVNSFTERELLRSVDAADRLPQLQDEYFVRLMDELFGFSQLKEQIQYLHRILQEHLYRHHDTLIKQYEDILRQFDANIIQVAAKFRTQYTTLASQTPNPSENEMLQDRIVKGATYFEEQLNTLMPQQLKDSRIDIANKAVSKQYNGALEAVTGTYENKVKLLRRIIQHGFTITTYLNDKASLMLDDIETKPGKTTAKSRKEKKTKAEKVDTREITLRLLTEGKSVKEIAQLRNFGTATIEKHLADLVARGTIRVDDYVSKDHQARIRQELLAQGMDAPLAAIKEMLPSDVTYCDIHMVKADISR